MAYRSTLDAVQDLERHGHLVRIQEEVDPDLEMAAIHRRVFARGGPALLFENVKGSPFPAVSNLFGTLERARFLFRRTLDDVKSIIAVRAHPPALLGQPSLLFRLPFAAAKALPKRILFKRFFAPVLANQTTIDKLPAPRSWPLDGGPFITLPQVYTEDPDRPGILSSNLGMYRVQLSGNRYETNRQIGLHYQIHRGIGVHHQKAIAAGKPLRVSIFVGGPPAHSLAAVMPLPEGLPEVAFAGALAGLRFRHTVCNGYRIAADADFCIIGTVEDFTLPEGPFGDHLGYYSLQHEFPVLRVEGVFHRKNAIWPFTVVGRPPAEDTIFGALIHELTGPMVPVSIPGLRAMHAVDAAGVHPLLLALGSERYTPYDTEEKPREILTIASAILGFGQASLAKYLMIAAGDAPDPHHAEEFFDYCLERMDFRRDLHFHTGTTIDTLDYSGTALNEGSKLVMACYGRPLRNLCSKLPDELRHSALSGFRWAFVRPGVIALATEPSTRSRDEDDPTLPPLIERLEAFEREYKNAFAGVAIIVLCDDPEFTAASFNNFLWITFTRSNPAQDVHGLHAFTKARHWGCSGPLLIDARLKRHMAPPLEEDQKTRERAERHFRKGAPLAPWG
jgi:4-hydroxy-3-polyprenylbenzoate decarboxylase